MITFERRKNDCLSKSDKSSIGEIDLPIRDLCEKINKLANYYTLSSCSGRVVLIKNTDKKGPGLFSFRTHKLISFKELKNELTRASEKKESLMFKQESVILHVCCKTLEDAESLLSKARSCGWKNSGIMTSAGRIVLELRSTEYLALPIMNSGQVLVSDDFLRVLVKESNKRLEKTWEKINKLEKSV